MAKDSVLALMREDAAKPPSEDKLDLIRKKIKELRDLDMEVAQLEEKKVEKNKRIYEIKANELVALFDQAKVDNIGIPEEGNLPAYNMEVGWHIKAHIGSAAEPKVDDYMKSIEYIKKHEPNIIKTTYTISFGLGEEKKRKEFEELLIKKKIAYSSNFGVPWNSLTAWLKNQLEAKKSPNLKLIGGTVERIAQMTKAVATRAKKAANEAKSTPKQRTK